MVVGDGASVTIGVAVRVRVATGVVVRVGVRVSVGVLVVTTVTVGVAVLPVTTIEPSLTTAGMYSARPLASSTDKRKVLVPGSRARKVMLASTPLPLTGAAGESSEYI